jgi:hypothetical protein
MKIEEEKRKEKIENNFVLKKKFKNELKAT